MGESLMPIYNYHCPDHGIFEHENSIDTRQSAPCPDCSLVCEKTLQGMKFNVMNAALPDGNNRFQDVKTAHKLKQLKARARAQGDIKTSDAISKELKKL